MEMSEREYERDSREDRKRNKFKVNVMNHPSEFSVTRQSVISGRSCPGLPEQIQLEIKTRSRRINNQRTHI